MTSILLPPPITPTLPPSATTPQAGTTTETRPSGLIVVRNELSPVTTGSKLILPSGPLTGTSAVDAAKAAYAEVIAARGPEAAEILLGSQLEMVERIHHDELNRQAVEALLAGNVELAAQIIAQQG